jgi:hypothetical protein
MPPASLTRSSATQLSGPRIRWTQTLEAAPVTRLIKWLLATLALACAAAGLVAATGTAPAHAAAAPVALGLHDGSINNCDNGGSESGNWRGGHAPTFTKARGAAAQHGMLGSGGQPSAWFTGLNASTVRLIVPWDIAIPDTSVTYRETASSPHRPAQDLLSFSGDNRAFESVHRQALREEEACFDYWLASETRSPFSASSEISACSDGGPSPAATSSAPISLRSRAVA